jgi:hypothetical protein
MENQSIVFKNSHLALMAAMLDVKLSGKESRKRNKFVNILNAKRDEFEKERVAIMEALAKKDDKGFPVVDMATSRYVFSNENIKKANDEHIALLEEECIFDIPDSVKGSLGFVKGLIVSTEIKFNSEDGRLYDEICEIFEKEVVTE